jgi:hypothetical protein
MTEHGKSNVTITSNIYDRQNFTKNVWGFDELAQLANKLGSDILPREQMRAYKRGAKPYYCTSNDEQAWGFIKNSNDEIVQSCRCEKPCSYLHDCMSEPYAKKIVRENTDIPQIENKPAERPDWIALESMSIDKIS